MATEAVDLNVSLLTGHSKRLASRLFHQLPESRNHARMEPSSAPDEYKILVEIPSPSGDSNRQVVLWMEDYVEPSVGFGEWHSHAGVETPDEDFTRQADGIIHLLQAILADQIVLIYDVGGSYDGNWGLVDLRDEDALLEELTSEFSPGRVKIRTWSGCGDREIGLEDLTADSPA
jgi:hypothetical protein